MEDYELTEEQMEKKKANPRAEIEQLIMTGNLTGLLLKAGELHGHFCSYMSLGVKAGAYAMREMGGSSDGMEHLIAIIETNNCFSDGVQITTACSFGNNALIYRDFGKTAVTFTRRDGNGIRISVRPEINELWEDRYPELSDLFKKVVAERGGTEDEKRRLGELSRRKSFDLLEAEPEEVFKIERVQVKVPEFAPIFDSVLCSRCGESVMATRIVDKEGDHVCIPCSGREYLEMDGSGLRSEATPRR